MGYDNLGGRNVNRDVMREPDSSPLDEIGQGQEGDLDRAIRLLLAQLCQDPPDEGVSFNSAI